MANINSPHIQEWLELLEKDDEVIFASIEKPLTQYAVKISQKFELHLMPKFFYKLPKPFRYALLGIALRLKPQRNFIYHAHNATGYGLMALLSGRKYILTVYGSEIYGASRRSIVYRLLLAKIVASSSSITASSQGMVRFIELNYFDSRKKINGFSLGVKSIFLEKKIGVGVSERGAGITWISNRRMHPHYHTLEIIEAFNSYKDSGGRGQLILIKGDADERYSEQALQATKGNSSIRVISEFLSASDLASLLRSSDFSISVPDTDQLSSSILESIACGCIPIIRPLDSYESISSASILIDPSRPLADELERIFELTARIPYEDIERRQQLGRSLILRVHSKESARQRYEDILSFAWQSSQ